MIGIDLGQSYFQHAITIVTNLFWFEYPYHRDLNQLYRMIQEIEFYIGDSPDYIDNPKCPGGPFLSL